MAAGSKVSLLTCVLFACDANGDPAVAPDAGTASALEAGLPVSDASRPVDAASVDARAADLDGALTPADAAEIADAARCSACCADGFPRGAAGTATRLVAHFTPSPEGVTVCPDGDVIVALDGNGELWRVPGGDGEPELWASVGNRQPAGVSCDARGRVFVAIYAVREGSPAPAPTLIAIEAAGAEPVLLPQPSGAAALQGLNGVVAVSGLGVYASDTMSQRIVLWTEANDGSFTSRVVASDVPMPNGLAFDPDTRKLYVATSLDQRVLAFAVADDGSLGASEEALRGPDLVGFLDGVAVDEAGELYAAAFLAGRVIRGKQGTAVGQVASPASLAFRGSTLFVSDYKFGAPDSEGGLYAVDLGVCGPGR